MQKLKEYKYIILVVLIILGFAFYWFEIRPSSIRKECLNRSMSDAPISRELFWNSYEFCLVDNGLKK